MGGAPFSREKINAREIALSSDENRSYQLWSRELQNVLGLGSADPVGVPFSSALSALALTFTSGFQMQLADGDAFFYFPTDPSLTVDDSAFEVLRWRSVAPLAFATPDATNPRIDLVVAQPASADADLTSRNILVDPSARTISAQNVFKTSNPTSIVTVVTGTPAGSPVPPAVPSGKCALFEVLVPAAATDASTFGTAPRLARRAPFPWSRISGILSGCNLTWDCSVDPTTTSAGLTMTGPSNFVVIDGEVLDASALFGIAVTQDTSNNPFGSAAGASDQPYFVYMCGGKNAPQGTPLSGGGMVPIAVVESLTAPNNLGQPFSSLTGPRGTIPPAAAVYVGIGFVVATTTRRRACIMTDDMTYIVGSDVANALQLTKTGAGVEALGTLGSRPTISRKVQGMLGLTAASAIAAVFMLPDDGTGTTASPGSAGSGLTHTAGVKTQVAASLAEGFVTFNFNPVNPKIWIGGSVLATSDGIVFSPNAYSHHVQRIAGVA